MYLALFPFIWLTCMYLVNTHVFFCQSTVEWLRTKMKLESEQTHYVSYIANEFASTVRSSTIKSCWWHTYGNKNKEPGKVKTGKQYRIGCPVISMTGICSCTNR